MENFVYESQDNPEEPLFTVKLVYLKALMYKSGLIPVVLFIFLIFSTAFFSALFLPIIKFIAFLFGIKHFFPEWIFLLAFALFVFVAGMPFLDFIARGYFSSTKCSFYEKEFVYESSFPIFQKEAVSYSNISSVSMLKTHFGTGCDVGTITISKVSGKPLILMNVPNPDKVKQDIDSLLRPKHF